MPRQNFMTISVPDTVQEMFNEFVRIKGVTKAGSPNRCFGNVYAGKR